MAVDPSQLNGIIYLRPLLATTSGSTGTGVQMCLSGQAASNKISVYERNGEFAGAGLVGEAGKMLEFTVRYTYEYIAANGDTAACAICTLEMLDITTGNLIHSVTTTSTSCVAPDSVLSFEVWANGTLDGTFYLDNLALYQK